MDDFMPSTLHTARDEWYARLLNVLTPCVIQGVREIFNEAFNTCKQQNELPNYLATFQSLLQLIPKWNAAIIEGERKRIIEKSGCNYLEDLVTCVHVIQLKVLTSIRVGNKQKKIDISIPSLDNFIHKIYVNAARKLYSNVYLFDMYAKAIEVQKHNREIELIINECILNAVRDSVPTESIIRAYLDEGIEHEELVKIETIDEPAPADETKQADSNAGVANTNANNPVIGGTPASDFGSTESKVEPSIVEPIPEPEPLRIPDTLPNIMDTDDKPVVTTMPSMMESFTIEEPREEKKDTDMLEKISIQKSILKSTPVLESESMKSEPLKVSFKSLDDDDDDMKPASLSGAFSGSARTDTKPVIQLNFTDLD